MDGISAAFGPRAPRRDREYRVWPMTNRAVARAYQRAPDHLRGMSRRRAGPLLPHGVAIGPRLQANERKPPHGLGVMCGGRTNTFAGWSHNRAPPSPLRCFNSLMRLRATRLYLILSMPAP